MIFNQVKNQTCSRHATLFHRLSVFFSSNVKLISDRHRISRHLFFTIIEVVKHKIGLGDGIIKTKGIGKRVVIMKTHSNCVGKK